MANTGILLRKDYKVNFDDVQVGEMVFAQDTNEIGMMVDGELYWQSWIDVTTSANYLFTGDDLPDDALAENGDKYIQTKDLGGSIELIEFKKEFGSWRELQKGMVDQTWAEINLEPNIHNETDFPYLGKYTYTMDEGYVPTEPLDVATKGYMDSIPGGTVGLVRLDGTTPMDSGYVPTLDGDVVTPNTFLNSFGIKLSTINPLIIGALWNDNGVPTINNLSYWRIEGHSTSTTSEYQDQFGGSCTDQSGQYQYVNVMAGWGGGVIYAGRIEIFKNGVYQTQIFAPTPASNEHFGRDFQVEGEVIVVGSSGTYNEVHVHSLDGTYLRTVTPHLITGSILFGRAVTTDGTVMAIGAPNTTTVQGTAAGIVQIFSVNGTFIRNIQSPVSGDSQQFGKTVSMYGDKIAIGAPGNGTDMEGKAYLFNIDGTYISELVNPLPEAGDLFGDENFMKTYKNHIVLGSYKADNYYSRVFLYNTSGVLITELIIPELYRSQYRTARFQSVDITDSSIYVGAQKVRYGSTYYVAGVVLEFDLLGNFKRPIWSPNIRKYAGFGSSVSVKGNTALIGAGQEDPQNVSYNFYGGAYIFKV